jgi:WD40 repeat protein
MFQFDVLSAHLNSSGQLVAGRTRLKALIQIGTASAGTVNIWDTMTAPVSVTYGRSGTTVTVTHTTHGFKTGDVVGLTFAAGTGGTATNGNYTITVTGANTYTITDLNSGTITAGAAGTAGTRWLMSLDTTGTSDVGPLLIPGDGIVARNGIYAQLSNQVGITVFYG